MYIPWCTHIIMLFFFQVCQDVAFHQHFVEQGRQWLEVKLTDLLGNV